MSRQTVRIAGRPVTLTNLDKPMWPELRLTKGDYIAYLLQMAPSLLPHLRGRPLVLTRYPDGCQGGRFYQKHTPASAPGWLKTWTDTEGRRPVRYLVCDDLPTLAWLGNQAALELHPWAATAAKPARPTAAVIDLDPPPTAAFAEVRALAEAVRQVVEEVGLRIYVKTSGATGLHLAIPLAPVHSWDETVAFTRAVCRLVERAAPERATTARKVEDRHGRVYLDFLQNGRGNTLVSAYGARPRPGAPVSAPVAWAELAAVTPAQFTVQTMPARVREAGDLFAPVLAGGQALFAAGQRLGAWPG